MIRDEGLNQVQAGQYLLVRYDEEQELHHMRFLCEHLGGLNWMILTPDGDIYEEDYAASNTDILSVHVMGPRGGVPQGINRGRVYRFDDLLNDGEKAEAFAAARAAFPNDRIRADVVRDAVVAPGLSANRPGGQSSNVGGTWRAVHDHFGVSAGDIVFLDHDAVVLGEYALYSIEGKTGIAYNTHVAGRAGNAQLNKWVKVQSFLFGSDVLPKEVPQVGSEFGVSPGPTAGSTKFDAFKRAMEGEAGVQEDKNEDPGDARTLAVHFEKDGERFRDYRDAVPMLTETSWRGFPIPGPRTIKWVTQFFKNSGVSPTQWHRNWQHLLKLQITDPGVAEHEVFCRVLESAICFDQLNVSELACFEILGRRFQLHEEKYRLKLVEAERGAFRGSGVDVDEVALFMGYSRDRGVACVCPLLLDHVSDQSRQEAAVLKERRKAHEERQLLRQSKPG